MAIIIDTNCIANVFSPKTANHSEFKPVLEWILLGKGLMIYGGSKYREELKKTAKYLPIIAEDLGVITADVDYNDVDNFFVVQAYIEDLLNPGTNIFTTTNSVSIESPDYAYNISLLIFPFLKIPY